MDKTLIEELDKDEQLQTSWVFWETFKGKSSADYTSNLKQLVEFDNLKDFASIWNNFLYKEISKICYDKIEDCAKRLIIDGKSETIESVCIFRKGILPAWEDQKNSEKADYKINILQLEPQQIDKVWEEFVLWLIGEQPQNSQRINGIRLLDKTHPSKPNKPNLRLEIWVDFTIYDEELKKTLEIDVKSFIDQNLESFIKNFDERGDWTEHSKH